VRVVRRLLNGNAKMEFPRLQVSPNNFGSLPDGLAAGSVASRAVIRRA
jgi:hypothetical protein